VVAAGDRDSTPVLTDTEGRFAIGGLPAGEFRVTASKAGVAPAAAGAASTGAAGRGIGLTAGAVVGNVVIELRRGAAISGVVIDETGEPVADASVMVEHADSARNASPVRVGMTDDLGQYRIASLPEGRVLVSVFSKPSEIVMLPSG